MRETVRGDSTPNASRPMGSLEQENRRRTRRGNIQKAILGAVAAAGVLSVAAIAPVVLIAIGIIARGSLRKNRLTAISNARARLVSAGLLIYTESGLLRLTPKGETKLRELKLADFKLKRPKRWDGKWRLLIFDIREERRPTRDKVRRTLRAIGFARLQDSVWVYPYDCEDLITLLKADFKIGKDLLYLIVDTIEHDRSLRERFSLPNERIR